MTRITIAGEANVPEGLKPGDKLRINATVYVHSASVDLIDVSRPGGPEESLPGERKIETVFLEAQVELA